MLHATEVLTPIDALADGLGWPADGLAAALEQLKAALPAVGLRLHQLHRDVRLVRAIEPVPKDALGQVLRKHLNRNGLGLSEGRVLYTYLHGEPSREPTNPQRVVTAMLTNAELLVPDEDNPSHLVPAAEVRFSFLLEEDDGPKDAPRYLGPSRRQQERRASGKQPGAAARQRALPPEAPSRAASGKKRATTTR